eukprot:1238413-Ditylum_brightwellii.AAC.2
MSHPMYLMSSQSVPLAASFWRKRTSVRRMGSSLVNGQNMRWSARGSEAMALSITEGRSRAMVMPSSWYLSIFARGMLWRYMSVASAGPKGMWLSKPSGGGMSSWFGEWLSTGFQKGFVSRSLLKSKTISEAMQNLVGARDKPKER